LVFTAHLSSAQNQPPVAVDDSIEIPENGFLFLEPLLNDNDPNYNDILTLTVLQPPFNSTLNILGNQLIVIPDLCYNGMDSITYLVCDNGSPSLCDTGFVSIDIFPLPFPEATADLLQYIDFVEQFTLPLANDTELQNEDLSLHLISGPNSGSAYVSNDTMYFQPDSLTAFAVDSIVYAACDPCNHCDTTIIKLVLESENTPPIAKEDNFETDEEEQISFEPASNDIDYDNNSLAIDTVLAGPFFGELNISGNGVFSYLPMLDFYGTDSIHYIVCDNGFPELCDSAWVILNIVPVDDPPIANDDSGTLFQGQNINIEIADNDVEVDGEQQSYSIVSQTGTGQASFSNGELIYEADVSFWGYDTLVYEVCDQGTILEYCDQASVIILVLVNVIDPMLVDDEFSVDEDGMINFNAITNDNALSGEDTSFVIIDGPYNGTLNGIDDYNYSYTPDPDFFGDDSLTYEVCSFFGDSISCAIAQVNFIVEAVNDPPIANDDFVNIDEEETILISVLANDEDIDDTQFNIFVIVDPQNGAAFVSGNQITYVPDVNYSGSDSISYQLCDVQVPALCDTAWIFVSIAGENDPPVAVIDLITTDEDESVDFDPLVNDLDVDGDPLNAILISEPANGMLSTDGSGTYTYAPDENFIGIDSIEYVICDILSQCDTSLIIIEVLFVNDLPIILNEFVETGFGNPITINVLANDSDEEGYDLSITILDGPYNGTEVTDFVNGAIVYTPNTNFSGSDSIVYLACDAGIPPACDTGVVYIEVADNQRPVAEDDFMVVVDDSVYLTNILTNDFDPDGNNLFYVINGLVNSSTDLGFIQDLGNGNISYQALEPYNGIDSFTYTLFDDGGLPQLVDIATVYVSASKTNFPPEAFPDTVSLDQAGMISINLLENDIEPENEPLNILWFSQPIGGNITLDNDGLLTYKGNPEFNGLDIIEYVVCDPLENCDTSVLSILVNEFTFSDLIKSTPNTITPNGDGRNEYFSIKNIESYPDNHLRIFNRWGEQGFESRQYNNNWNGTFQNTAVPLPEGTYYYLFDINDLTGGSERLTGFIQIIR